MRREDQAPAPDVVIVTTENRLRQLVNTAVNDAVRRALGELRNDSRAGRRDDGEWVPEREARRLYGRSRSTLARWRKADLVPHVRIGGSVYYGRPSGPGSDRTSGLPP